MYLFLPTHFTPVYIHYFLKINLYQSNIRAIIDKNMYIYNTLILLFQHPVTTTTATLAKTTTLRIHQRYNTKRPLEERNQFKIGAQMEVLKTQ